jgi:cob(I)alamin adenosyltransferase
MSITTKRGDGGETDLLFGARVAKSHPRVHALGAVDELNAALGLLRVTARVEGTREFVASVQRQLIDMMGILATPAGEEARHARTYEGGISEAEIASLDNLIARLEAEGCGDVCDWALPGAAGVLSGAHADLARTICRRAERCIADLAPTPERVANGDVVRFLNRLSDALWLVARREERGDR